MTIYIKKNNKYIPLIHEAELAEKTGEKRETLRKRRQYHGSKGTMKVQGGTYYLPEKLPEELLDEN